MANKDKQNIPVKVSGEVAKSAVLPALHPVTDMERLFERFFGRGWPSLLHWQNTPLLGNLLEAPELRMPSLDVIDRDNEILVRAEVPGIEKKDLDISLTDNLLTIKGQSSREEKEEKGDYHRREISRSSFARSVTLPGTVDSSKAAATLKDGMLEINLPKVESSRRRSIAVG